MEDLSVDPGSCVLLLWGAQDNPDKLKAACERISEITGQDGKVQVEHIERLKQSGHSPGTFDAALLGCLTAGRGDLDSQLLAQIALVLKPSGRLILRHIGTALDSLLSVLKLAGFIDVIVKTGTVQQAGNDVVSIHCKKPNYEVGSSSQRKLNLGAAPQTTSAPDSAAAQVWSLSANDMNDDDVELMDSDDLLDEDDLKKPDPASLRAVCGDATKKRKACKNCSCGLAEELASETKPAAKKNPATSSCGSCYLGDAFRCASCPYLGMPAFKPGEKITLSSRQLLADQ